MDASRQISPLDDVDRAILQCLQRDARYATAVEIAERVGVSDGTVRNRIDDLKEQNVIEGFVPLINYEEAGYPLRIKIRCTARIVTREELARKALKQKGVIDVEEIMTGRKNIEVTAVAPTHNDLTDTAKALDELGLEIESEELVRHHDFRPLNHFGTEDVRGEVSGAYRI